MKADWLFPILLSLVALLIDPFVRMDLVLVVVMVVAWHTQPAASFGTAVVLGWLTDIRQMRVVGASSIFLLFLAMVIQLVKWQFGSKNMFGVVIVALVASSLRQLIFSQLALEVVIWELGLTVVMWWSYAVFKVSEGVYLK